MTTIYTEADAKLEALDDETVAVVGYGNQGRSWALNLRDSGLTPVVCVRRDETREQAVDDGFAAAEIEAANDATVVCVLVPDDIIPSLGAARPAGWLHDRRQRLHAGIRPTEASTATSAWWRRACSARRCGAVTRRESGSSARSACTVT